jgi:hypothetical protein
VQFSTYQLKPKTIQAVHFEKAGTYTVEGYPITIDEDDTYVVKTMTGYETRIGSIFRTTWESEVV